VELFDGFISKQRQFEFFPPDSCREEKVLKTRSNGAGGQGFWH
jgi:hypothetical protein